MFQLAPLLVALAVPAENAEPEFVATVAAVERMPMAVPITRATVSVDSLAMRIEVTSPDARAIQQRFIASSPQLCPFVSRSGNTVALDCRTPRIDAHLEAGNGRPYLEVRELRGVPMAEDGNQIWTFYHPIALKFGSGCPGDTPASRGECHFKAGRFTEAAIEFRKALKTEHRRLATLRLGDISLRTDDPATAAGWYRMVGHFGSYGRMAVARLCELGGSCLGELSKKVFNADMLPEPLASEMLLRGARAFAYIGAVKDSMTSLIAAMRSSPRICEGEVRPLCRRLVLFALKFPSVEGGFEAIQAYLDLPERTEGLLAIEMSRAAGEKALDIGAPLFGGHLLAAAVPWVEGNDVTAVGEHVLRAAEMYLIANEPGRARTLYEYAEGRLGRRRMTGPRWAAVSSATANADVSEKAPDSDAITAAASDLAAAYTAASRSVRFRRTQVRATSPESP